MIQADHVRHAHSEPRYAARRPLARELSRGGQGQVAHARQHLRLAGGQDRQPAPGAGRGDPRPARRRALRDRPRAGARPCRRSVGTARRLGLDKMLPQGPERRARLILAMIVARIVEPAAKLSTARGLSEATAAHSLGAVLGLGEVDADELYAALDLLGRSQARIENVLAERHLKDGVLVLYDVTSSYLEGRRCELAQFGFSRDHRSDRPQIVFGLLCTSEGCPVA